MHAARCWSSACTPPGPTRPKRCSVPPRCLHVGAQLEQRRVLEERARLDRVVDAHDVLGDDAPGAEVEVADLGVAHLARRAGPRRGPRPRAASAAAIPTAGATRGCAPARSRSPRRRGGSPSRPAPPAPPVRVSAPRRLTSLLPCSTMTFVRNRRPQSTPARRPQPAAHALLAIGLAGLLAPWAVAAPGAADGDRAPRRRAVPGRQRRQPAGPARGRCGRDGGGGAGRPHRDHGGRVDHRHSPCGPRTRTARPGARPRREPAASRPTAGCVARLVRGALRRLRWSGAAGGCTCGAVVLGRAPRGDGPAPARPRVAPPGRQRRHAAPTRARRAAAAASSSTARPDAPADRRARGGEPGAQSRRARASGSACEASGWVKASDVRGAGADA